MIFQHALLDEIHDTLLDENPLKLDTFKVKDAYMHESALIYSYVYSYAPPPSKPVTEKAVGELAFCVRQVFETTRFKVLETDVVINLARALITNARNRERVLIDETRGTPAPVKVEEAEPAYDDALIDAIQEMFSDESKHQDSFADLPPLEVDDKDSKK